MVEDDDEVTVIVRSKNCETVSTIYSLKTVAPFSEKSKVDIKVRYDTDTKYYVGTLIYKGHNLNLGIKN